MRDIQSVFDRSQDLKRKQRELKRAYRDSLDQSLQYQQVVEKLDELKEKKKSIEATIKKDFPQLDKLKNDIASDAEMLSDLALNSLIKGQPIDITDEYKNKYEPVLSVRFRKIG
ncbi:MAG: hypothetical protein JW816_01560 [Candidatus Buchananbacteria bacterium]|nr:hypothetical protein [Candidatus Buchananbacteria bacterium]